MSLPLKILLRALLTMGLVWFLSNFVDQYFVVHGGLTAYIVIGALLTLMNLFVRPILDAITLPLKLLATIIAIILVNGIFLFVTEEIALLFDPKLVAMDVTGGIGGFITVALILGFVNWLMKEFLR